MESFLIQDRSFPSVQSAIEQAVESRIATDPDVADCYMRVDFDTMAVHVMYIEESNAHEDNSSDYALLNLMTEISNDKWKPDKAAIFKYADSFC